MRKKARNVISIMAALILGVTGSCVGIPAAHGQERAQERILYVAPDGDDAEGNEKVEAKDVLAILQKVNGKDVAGL